MTTDATASGGYSTIIYTKEDGVAVITLNRPDALNTFNSQLFQELHEALQDVEADDDVRVMVMTGAPRRDGRPCFSAGGDLKEIAAKGLENMGLKARTIHGEVEGIQKVAGISGIAAMPKPTIAAIDGVCTAGGIEMAEAFDIRIAAETAQISDMHIKNLGVSAPVGTAWLPRLVGVARAKELIFTGDAIDGHEAWRIGFANHVVPSAELMPFTMNLAKKIAGMDPNGLRLAKAAINASVDTDLARALAYSKLCFAAYSPLDRAEQFAAKGTDAKNTAKDKENTA